MSGLPIKTRKPSWLKVKLPTGAKQERFARAFVNDEVMGKHLQPPPDNSMRSDGSSSRQSETGRAMFSRR